MRKALSVFLGLTLLVATLASGSAVARPLTPAEQRYLPMSGALPFCDNTRVLSDINARFHHRERGYWGSGLAIVGFQGVQEIGYRAIGVDYIPRRYCKALVFMSDHKVREMSYSVATGLGPIGMGWGADWCISGLDRNYAFGLDCRSVRP